jgi:hypothetical protein
MYALELHAFEIRKKKVEAGGKTRLAFAKVACQPLLLMTIFCGSTRVRAPFGFWIRYRT